SSKIEVDPLPCKRPVKRRPTEWDDCKKYRTDDRNRVGKVHHQGFDIMGNSGEVASAAESIKAKCKSLADEVQARPSTRNHSQSDIVAVLSRYSDAAGNLAAAVGFDGRSMHQLQTANEKLEQQHAEVSHSFMQLEKDHEVLQQEHQRTQGRMQEMQATIEKLQKRHKSENQDYNHLQKQHESDESMIKRLQSENGSLQAQHASDKRSIQEKEDNLMALQKQHKSDTRAKMQEAKAQEAKVQKANEKLQERHESDRKSMKQQQEIYKTLHEKYSRDCLQEGWRRNPNPKGYNRRA
ncbi:MAG: hypothetical protein Q9224_007332, partial [Gallowayella concinna]